MEKPYTKYWKIISKKATKLDVIFICAVKAFFAKNSNATNREEIFNALITKSFTPITNKKKLENGMIPFQCLKEVFTELYYYLDTRYNVLDIFGDLETFNEFKKFVFNFHKVLPHYFDSRFKKRYYSYIFVDQNGVEPIYQAVQAAHVAMVIGQKMERSFDASEIYFQVCKVPVDIPILTLFKFIGLNGFKVERFYETDVDRVIAIGVHPVRSDKRKFLKEYELLNFGV